MCMVDIMYIVHWPLGDDVVIFKSVIFKCILQIKFMNANEINLWWMPKNILIDKSALVQVMACC